MKHLESLQDRNIIMTGGTGGIGSEVVSELVKYAGRIILLLQDPGKFNEVIKDPQVRQS